MPDLQQAITLHRAGKLAEAESIYRQILAQQPNHAEALHLRGLIACQNNRLEAAEGLIQQAIAQNPSNSEYHVNLGEVQRRQGKFKEAAATARHAAELAPQNAIAHYNLGVALTAANDGAAAIAAYRRALELQPKFPEALNNLGLQLRLAGQNQEAADTLRAALALRPNHAEAENNLGLALWNLGRYQESVDAFTRATSIRPDFAAAHANRGFALRRTGHRLEAVGAFQKAAQLAPNSPDIHRDLAKALHEIRSFDAAIAAARRAVELAPQQADTHQCLGVVLGSLSRTDGSRRDEAIACYLRALALDRRHEWEFELAILRDQTPNACPDEYVRKLFDDYAPSFEAHLVGQLNYHVPEKLLEALQNTWRELGIPAVNLDILDLGCGTGLCGEFFRPHARHITGIDLAGRMIAAAGNRRDARGKPYYDRLIHAHIIPALGEFQNAFDLILAADVLIYVGELQAITAAATRALKPGGMLAFSLERYDADDQDYILRERFRHSLGYIRRLAAANTLTQLRVETCHLRNDVQPGWLVVLRK